MRMKYTTIGDPVNTAARLESMDKQAFGDAEDESDCRILIADSTRKLLGDGFRVVAVGTMTLKGKQEQVQVYSVQGRLE
jgi:adenylate cyclase